MFLLGTDTRFTDGAGAADISRAGAMPFRADRSAQRSAASCSAPMQSDCITRSVQRIEGYNISIGRPVALTVFRSAANAMTAANGLNHGDTARRSRRCAVAPPMSARRSRVLARPAAHSLAQSVAAAAAAARRSRPDLRCWSFLLVMFLADAAAINGVGHLPRWIIWCFDQITDFGKSGWFLWPLGILFLALAALPSLPRVPQLVLAAIMVRVGFLFAAIGAARPVRHHHQAHDRAGAAAGRRQSRSVSVQPVQVDAPTMPACRPAMPPRPSRCWSPSARCGRARAPYCGSMPC